MKFAHCFISTSLAAAAELTVLVLQCGLGCHLCGFVDIIVL